jgi:hypothetical protein
MSMLPSTMKNSGKYWSYRIAWSRIAEAIDDGYHLEAVTIAESIIADRVLSFLVSRGVTVKPHSPLHVLIAKLRKEADDEGCLLADRIDGWRKHRNTLVHGIVKSARGEAPIDMMDFVELAEISAHEGRALARSVSTWQKKHANRLTETLGRQISRRSRSQ